MDFLKYLMFIVFPTIKWQLRSHYLLRCYINLVLKSDFISYLFEQIRKLFLMGFESNNLHNLDWSIYSLIYYSK